MMPCRERYAGREVLPLLLVRWVKVNLWPMRPSIPLNEGDNEKYRSCRWIGFKKPLSYCTVYIRDRTLPCYVEV